MGLSNGTLRDPLACLWVEKSRSEKLSRAVKYLPTGEKVITVSCLICLDCIGKLREILNMSSYLIQTNVSTDWKIGKRKCVEAGTAAAPWYVQLNR